MDLMIEKMLYKAQNVAFFVELFQEIGFHTFRKFFQSSQSVSQLNSVEILFCFILSRNCALLDQVFETSNAL